MDLTPEKVREILKIAQEPVSLETPIGEEDDSHLGDFIEDQDATSPSEHAAYELLKNSLKMFLIHSQIVKKMCFVFVLVLMMVVHAHLKK